MDQKSHTSNILILSFIISPPCTISKRSRCLIATTRVSSRSFIELSSKKGCIGNFCVTISFRKKSITVQNSQRNSITHQLYLNASICLLLAVARAIRCCASILSNSIFCFRSLQSGRISSIYEIKYNEG